MRVLINQKLTYDDRMTSVPKILLVDDNPDNLKALEVVLRGLPAELIKVTNGNDALKATLHHDFALALLDVQMPEMDGYELANILKTEEKTENLPFIFISAVYTDHVNITKGYTRGAYNFFAKPFDPDTLIRSVELFLDKHNRLAQQAMLNKRLDERSREIEQKNVQLERMNKELQSFVQIASHDLQEPLRKIHTFSNLILQEEKRSLSETASHYFKRIETCAVRMQALIDDLLTYSKSSNIDQIFELTDLNDILKSVQDDFKEVLEEKKAIIIVELPKAKVIPFQLRQMFHNLVSNAIKYSSKERALTIEITWESVTGREVKEKSLSPAQTYFHIAVKDNGIGFDPVYKDKIFEMFQRLHRKSEYSGTGIGLAIVKKIIDNHHGAITASSAVNKGTTFHIYLPDF
jgi:two-component system, sensor histidine kinase and response regulator